MIAATLEGNDLRFSHIFLLTHSLAPHQHTQLTKSPLMCVERISFLKKFNPQRETSVFSSFLFRFPFSGVVEVRKSMCPFQMLRREFDSNLFTP